MYDFIASLLSWLYEFWPSYGGAIILLTLIIMTVLAPFTIRQTRSMLAMQRLQPEIKRLRAKHGKDRERLNQEMMALYQANNVNPLGGCLPLLIQMPIFLVLFQVVRGLTRRVTETGLVVGSRSLGATNEPGEFAKRTFNPDYLSADSQLAQDLSMSDEMKSLGLDLSQSAQGALSDSILTGIPYLLLVIGVGVSTWLQQRQIQGRQKSAAEINPQQQAIMKILPFMLPVFSFGFPAALVVYWFVSNLFRVGQQMFITHRVYGGDDDGEIVRPKADAIEKTNNQTARKKPATKQGEGGTHGRRSPVSSPPPKKKKKKPPAEPEKPAAKRSKPEKREPQERQTSKRVTPKKNDGADSSSTSRRNRKKK